MFGVWGSTRNPERGTRGVSTPGVWGLKLNPEPGTWNLELERSERFALLQAIAHSEATNEVNRPMVKNLQDAIEQLQQPNNLAANYVPNAKSFILGLFKAIRTIALRKTLQTIWIYLLFKWITQGLTFWKYWYCNHTLHFQIHRLLIHGSFTNPEPQKYWRRPWKRLQNRTFSTSGGNVVL